MPLKKIFAVFSLFILGACNHPDKPIVTQCQLDVPAGEGICGSTGQGSDTHTQRRPILELDKSTCFPPPDWKKVKDYVKKLEAYADELERNCK